MKKLLLTACTTVSLALAACDETPKTQSPTPSAPKITANATPRPVFAEVAITPDAGMKETPKDPLALEHGHRGEVDHVGRARELKSSGDFEGAITEARRALFHEPADEDALEILTRVSELTGQKQLLVDALARSAELSPEDPQPLIRQARVLVRMNKTKEAIEVAQNALMRDGEQPEAYHVMGRAYLSRGELAKAIELFKRTVELSPEHAFAMNNLGFAYLRANQNEEAVEVLTKASELLPTVAYVHNNLGVALERVGRIEEAKLAFRTATDLSPKYVKAQINSKRVAKVASATDPMGDPELSPEPDLAPEQ